MRKWAARWTRSRHILAVGVFAEYVADSDRLRLLRWMWHGEESTNA